MKAVKLISIILFFTVIALPLSAFNFKPNQSSGIDNRDLAENPFTNSSGNFSADLTAYAEDRIGFRSEMINCYTYLNDLLFGEMTHPSYTYGKDSYVFFKMSKNKTYGEYENTFVEFTKKAQDYCTDRNIPFIFAFSPSKISVMQDKLPRGVNYDNSWVYTLFDRLKQSGVRYVENLTALTELYKSGEKVFNKQYNAGHWNDLGAFYGVNNILTELKKDFPLLHINSLDEFDIEEKLETSLMVSKFPIEDYDTIFTAKKQSENIIDEYRDELEINEQYKNVGYYLNNNREQSDKQRLLVFQGSYMNGMGYKFFANACAEYIYVHDYQNIINLDYYVNVFQPDYVIFEAAEYVLNDTYFDSQSMSEKQFNPGIETLSHTEIGILESDDYVINAGNAITKITVDVSAHKGKYFYLRVGDSVLDLIKTDGGEYVASMRNDEFEDGLLVLISGY